LHVLNPLQSPILRDNPNGAVFWMLFILAIVIHDHARKSKLPELFSCGRHRCSRHNFGFFAAYKA